MSCMYQCTSQNVLSEKSRSRFFHYTVIGLTQVKYTTLLIMAMHMIKVKCGSEKSTHDIYEERGKGMGKKRVTE